jgi:sphinganine C4-monooxygenase
MLNTLCGLIDSDRSTPQVIGTKSNFAQPFFVHWDTLLGTRMTREDIERRRQKQSKTQ